MVFPTDRRRSRCQIALRFVILPLRLHHPSGNSESLVRSPMNWLSSKVNRQEFKIQNSKARKVVESIKTETLYYWSAFK
ncbi:hypothetical protein SPOG_05720 [Schizosaccharomyces cryophilus OY26]|uniref:Uncharacterized protein n=1 Tax=Schizosaccharomyces cryophilus (strain OY26 / ATCC MYA-4695 / CBS 11777 / NBRC 106824 / NRRL Y48691) TaxID=653667 RepID=S9W1F8_SCHCR|nr:uncharacterized protein SPOG_05720 [Schizosaccharomyces cryophilus OY26]EPY53813.1 hypothetical protein SPOG_05720 [Schizosaccharomyces cryophilus OY26]